MGPYLSSHTMFLKFEFLKKRRNENPCCIGLERALVEERKFLSFGLESAMLWYCDQHLLLGKSTFSLVWFNIEPIVQIGMGMNA